MNLRKRKDERRRNGMKILMTLSNPFTHDPRVYNEALTLVKIGHKVTVLAWDRKNQILPPETRDGIKIIRSYNTDFMKLLPHDFFRFRYWWNQGYKDALKLYKKEPFDVVHSHDFDSLPIGVKLKKKLGIKLVYDAHEIWGYMVAADLPKVAVDYFLNQEKKLIKKIDAFIIAEDKYADYYKTITNVELTPILNCKHLISKNYEPPGNKEFISLYLGSLDQNRFLLELVDVLGEIKNVRCIIGGMRSRTSYFNALINKCNNTPNVDFIGKVPMKDVIPMTKKADVIICMIQPYNINTKWATANKQFEAMVTGRPIICTKGTRSGEITKQEKCGIVVDYTKEALKEAIIKLRDNPKLRKDLGKNALKAAINKYNWELEEKKLQELYDKLKVKK